LFSYKFFSTLKISRIPKKLRLKWHVPTARPLSKQLTQTTDLQYPEIGAKIPRANNETADSRLHAFHSQLAMWPLTWQNYQRNQAR
jgi:hypothetical protein